VTERERAAPRPRVLHVMDNLGTGGMELALLRLVERTRDRFDHSICCVRDLGVCAQRFAAAGASLTFIGKLAGHDWRVPWRVARVCHRLRPHIVHTRNWGAIEGIFAARLARVPLVIHGEHGRDAADGAASDARRDRIRRLLFPLADRIVVVSHHLERWLLEDLATPRRKAARIPTGVDTDRFLPAADRERLRRERGYMPTELLIGAVGRLHAVKNYSALIAAFETVRKCHPEARLAIVGDGPERTALVGELRRRGLQHAVRLTGERDDVHEWLAAMDLFVQPSLTEGISNAVLEAMSVALPVVVTRVGGSGEVVQDGVTGRLVEARDPAALVDAISFYRRMPTARRDHGRAGRARVLEQFSLPRMVEALYEDALARRCARIVEGSRAAS
jgi:sugar transferase (PEP-CTERM/EpsH1 system associated)